MIIYKYYCMYIKFNAFITNEYRKKYMYIFTDLGRIIDEYIEPIMWTSTDAINGIEDNGSLWAAYAASKSLLLNVRNIDVSFESSLFFFSRKSII